MHQLPGPLLDAAQLLRDAFAGELGEACQLSINGADGVTVCVHRDGAIVALRGPGGAQILRQGRASANVRTARAR